ncbi:hypothetical protein BH11MYX3_BH11MYX3_46220 [soil metagenome]
MPFSPAIEYASEGAPLIVGDVEHVQHWTGRRDNGGGVTIVYGGIGLEKFPKPIAQTAKVGGKREKKLKTAAEADAFEAELLALFLARHPTAKRPSKYPAYSRWYVGTEHNGVYPSGDAVFEIDRRFTSDFSAMTKRLKGDAAAIEFNKKVGAKALFLGLQSNGPGEIANTVEGNTIVIACVLTADGEPKNLVSSLEKARMPKVLGTTELAGNVVVYDSSFSGAELAQHCWSTASLVDGFERATGALGPLRIPEQSKAGGAFLRVRPGTYNYGITRNHAVKGVVFDAFWLWQA